MNSQRKSLLLQVFGKKDEVTSVVKELVAGWVSPLS